jgi:hypothetical protein
MDKTSLWGALNIQKEDFCVKGFKHRNLSTRFEHKILFLFGGFFSGVSGGVAVEVGPSEGLTYRGMNKN